MTRESALSLVYNQKQGSIKDLKSLIGSNFVKDFELVGYITKGVDGSGDNTWQITLSGKDSYKQIYMRPNLAEQFLGLFCHYVLRY
jgi:hypothetical protein